MSIIFKVTLTILIIYIVTCEGKKCDGKTCAQCIGESVDCVWCSAENHVGPRCETNNTVDSSWCSKNVDNPGHDRVSINFIRNDPITAGPGPVVQLAPQELKISIRPGQTEQLTIKYKPAKDYPLDVYYLMDASHTMKDTVKLLKEQGEEIYNRLNQFTNNVRLGVGSFIEKAALPFANPNTHYTYAFKHHLNLTTDRVNFKSVLDKVSKKTGSNYEDPEAGLDALMQVMACTDEINWRKYARKIIVLCTDATYHSAGDGKIVGAAKLNDMECHLNKDGAYTLELEQDYPTVNQIRKVAKRENIIVLFNVKKRATREYKALADRLDIGAEVIELKEKSNITKTLTDVYTRKLDNVQMDVLTPRNVRAKLTPDCTHQDTCEVAHGKDTLIEVSVTADYCLDKDKNNIITIKPNGLGETVTITIETICECECEKNPKPNAIECSSGGSLVCEICECNADRFGDKCDCIGSSPKHLNDCKAHPEDTVLCSGVGSCICLLKFQIDNCYELDEIETDNAPTLNCVPICIYCYSCGKCDCGLLYSGAFCQFDNGACNRVNGILCSDHGTCREGSCHCEGWTGPACECPLDDNGCRAPYSGKVCSDNGICECGECNCTRRDSKNNFFFGPYCDNCHDCDESRCKELEKYVLCVYETPIEVCEEKFNIKNTKVEKVNKTEINTPKYHLAKRCTVLREDGKSIVFKHKYEKKILLIIIQTELEEPDRANMWIAIGSAIGAILLIGLLTVLIWKCLVDMYDAREYKRFNKLLDESGDISNINEIYKAPTANFMNPMFNRRSRISTMLR